MDRIKVTESKLRKLIVCFGILLLTACAGLEPIRLKDELPPNAGVVVFKVSSNDRPFFAPEGFRELRKWRTATIESINNTNQSIIFSASDKNFSRGVFIAVVPPGTYKLTEIAAATMAPAQALYPMTTILSPNEDFGTFTVKPSSITNLGHLVDQPTSDRNVIIGIKENSEGWFETHLKTFYPSIHKQVKKNRVLGWDKPMQSNRAYDAIRARAVGLLSPYVTSEDQVMFGTFVGSLKIWSPGAGVSSYSTPIRGTLEAVIETQNRGWVVGGEDGNVFISSDRAASWQSLGTPLDGSSIVALNRAKEKIFATVATQTSTAIYYWTKQNNSWELVTTIALQNAGLVKSTVPSSSRILNETLVTYVPGKQLYITNTETLSTEVNEFPGAVDWFDITNDGAIRCRCTKSLGFSPYESHDLGKTWIKSNHKRSILAYITPDGKGYGFDRAAFGKGVFYTSADSGRNWVEFSRPGVYAPYISQLKKNKTLFAYTDIGTLRYSIDGGQTWVRVPDY